MGKMQTQGVVRAEPMQLLRHDGEIINVEISSQVIETDESSPYYEGVLVDVTDRKKSDLTHNQLLAEFEHRNLLLRTAAEVSKSASVILDPHELIQETVDLIRERFGYYYVGIFLVDKEGQYAVLRAGTGDAGKRMLAEGHRLAVGGESMIGWSVANAQARIALDVGEEAVRFDNPHLPETRSEMALPLVTQGKAIGALTVQSVEGAAFSEANIAVLQTMADQLANAIQNAYLYETAQTEIAERKRALKALQESEEQIRLQASALNAAADGIIIVDADNEIIWANPAMETLSGYALDEIIGASPEIFGSEIQDGDFNTELDLVLQKKQVWQGEIVNRRKDGQSYFEEQTITPVQNNGGDVTHYIAIKRNINTRKEAEEALRSSEEKFATFFHASPTPMAITAFPEGLIVDVNNSFLDYLGYQRQDVVGRVDLELDIWDDLDDRLELTVRLGEQGHVRNFEIKYRTRNGTVKTALLSAQFIQIDEQTYLLNSMQDITDRKHAEAEIERRSRQLAALVQMGQTVASTLDLDEVLDQVVNSVPALVNSEAVSLLMLEGDDELVFSALSEGDESGMQENLHGQRMPATAGVAGEVIRKGKSIHVNEIGDHDPVYRQLEGLSGYHTQSILAVPLMLGDQITGVMEAVHSQPGVFSADDLQMMEATSQWASIAISNARQHEHIQQRYQESQTMTMISQALTETLDLEEVLQLIGESAYTVIASTQQVVIHLLNEEIQSLWPVVAIGLDQKGQPHFNMSVGEGIAGKVIAEGKTINVGDIDNDSRYISLDTPSRLRSLMVAPVISGEHKLGTISVQSENCDAFSADDERLLTTLGFQAALAIENARLFKAELRRSTELEKLRQASLRITSTLELKPILETILSYAQELVGADDVHVFSYDGEVLTFGGALWAGEYQPAPFSEPRPDGVTHRVARSAERIVVPDLANDPLFEDTQWNGAITGLPLCISDRVLGVLNVAFVEPHDFDDNELRVLELLADQAAAALQNARLFESERSRRQEAETLRSVTTALTSSLEMERVLDLVLANLEQVISYHSAAVFLEREDALEIMAGRGFEMPENILGRKLPKNSLLFPELEEKRAPLIFEDVTKDSRWQKWEDATEIHGWMGVPLIVKQRVIGYVTFDSPAVGAYSESDASLAQAIASQAAMAIENARLFESLQYRLKEVNTLFRISQEVVASLEEFETLKRVVDLLQENFGYYHVHVYLFDPERNFLVTCEGSGQAGEVLKSQNYALALDEGIIGNVASSGQELVTNDVSEVDFFVRNPHLPDTTAELAVPLKIGKEVIGVLDILHQHPNIFDDNDLRLVFTVADQLSVVLHKAKIYAELQDALEKEQSTRSQLVQAGKLTALGRIVASVSHELNNPLQAIQNALYLVKLEDSLSDQSHEDIEVALSETTRMANLIARLRETYRPTTAQEFQPASLNDLVDDVHKLITTHLRHNKVGFEFRPDIDLPEVKMVADQIKQVILNICLNAIEHMSQGGRLRIVTETLKEEILLVVADTGAGIKGEDLDNIFEPFYTTKEGGTGLGLSITYDIIQKHSGRIEVESEVGQGTIFNIWLPRRR